MPEVKIEGGKALGWLQKGATPSETARTLLKQTGIWQRFQLLKQGKSAEEAEAEVSKILDVRAGKAAAKSAVPKPAASEETPPATQPESADAEEPSKSGADSEQGE
jgi:small subunit ribosomal protein S16